ncbi:MAG: L-threonylcarbamoyladenylate synthase [Candidatus Hermodarchaeota archaeon]
MKLTELKLTPGKLLPFKSLQKIVDHLHLGGILILPTDTGYLLGVDALNISAVNHIFSVKKRPRTNPIHIAVCSIEMAMQYVNIGSNDLLLYKNFLPGPLTIVSPKKINIPDILVANKHTLGVRIPDSPIVQQVIHSFGKPITATSANISGRQSLSIDQELAELNFGEEEQIYLVKDDKMIYEKASTVVSCATMPPKIIREGPIKAKDILNILKITSNL